MSIRRVIFLGERMNYSGREPARFWSSVSSYSPDRYFELMWRHGAFTETQRQMLVSLLPLKICNTTEVNYMNLLPPSPVPGKWNTVEAKNAAKMFIAGAAACLPESVANILVVMCCGTRVASAFKPVMIQYPEHLGDASETLGFPGILLARVPHPSGLNRQWNNRDTIDRCRERLREVFT